MYRDEKNTAIYVAYDDAQPFDGVGPEKHLLLAILLSALSDLKKPGDAGRKAVEYFLSSDDDYIFSFQSVCDYLAIDPKQILLVTGLDKHLKKAELPRGDSEEAFALAAAPR